MACSADDPRGIRWRCRDPPTASEDGDAGGGRATTRSPPKSPPPPLRWFSDEPSNFLLTSPSRVLRRSPARGFLSFWLMFAPSPFRAGRLRPRDLRVPSQGQHPLRCGARREQPRPQPSQRSLSVEGQPHQEAQIALAPRTTRAATMDWGSAAGSPVSLGEGTVNQFPAAPTPAISTMSQARSTRSLTRLDHFRSEYSRPSDTDVLGRPRLKPIRVRLSQRSRARAAPRTASLRDGAVFGAGSRRGAERGWYSTRARPSATKIDGRRFDRTVT